MFTVEVAVNVGIGGYCKAFIIGRKFNGVRMFEVLCNSARICKRGEGGSQGNKRLRRSAVHPVVIGLCWKCWDSFNICFYCIRF